MNRLSIFNALFVSSACFVAACGDSSGDGAGGGGNGSGANGTGGSTTSGCTSAGCEGGSPPIGGAGEGGAPACPEVFEFDVKLNTTGGPAVCDDFGPGVCNMVQDGCAVQLSCDNYDPVQLQIDAEGVSNDWVIPLGDGINGTCHATFGNSDDPITITCSAAGVICEFS